MQNPVDTPFWEKKWNKTYGYLLFKKSFGLMDVYNARFRYRRKNSDDHFPITWSKKDLTIIRNKVHPPLDKDLFWAAVVAPTQAFFEDDWQGWKKRGQDFRDMQLVALILKEEMLKGLSKEEKERVKLAASTELINRNILKVKEKPVPYIEPIYIEKKMDFEPREEVSDEDVMSALEGLDL
jgi:hypothetical protein